MNSVLNKPSPVSTCRQPAGAAWMPQIAVTFDIDSNASCNSAKDNNRQKTDPDQAIRVLQDTSSACEGRRGTPTRSQGPANREARTCERSSRGEEIALTSMATRSPRTKVQHRTAIKASERLSRRRNAAIEPSPGLGELTQFGGEGVLAQQAQWYTPPQPQSRPNPQPSLGRHVVIGIRGINEIRTACRQGAFVRGGGFPAHPCVSKIERRPASKISECPTRLY